MLISLDQFADNGFFAMGNVKTKIGEVVHGVE